jgi:hypothetical protein
MFTAPKPKRRKQLRIFLEGPGRPLSKLFYTDVNNKQPQPDRPTQTIFGMQVIINPFLPPNRIILVNPADVADSVIIDIDIIES